jgi:hypothetical protein
MDADLCQLLAMGSGSGTTVERDRRYLQRWIFIGLKDINTGFDSRAICHFSREDFLTVIDRCERLNVQIVGIEVFSLNVELLGVEISPEPGFGWARRSPSVVPICVEHPVQDVRPPPIAVKSRMCSPLWAATTETRVG